MQDAGKKQVAAILGVQAARAATQPRPFLRLERQHLAVQVARHQHVQSCQLAGRTSVCVTLWIAPDSAQAYLGCIPSCSFCPAASLQSMSCRVTRLVMGACSGARGGGRRRSCSALCRASWRRLRSAFASRASPAAAT